MSKKKIWEKLLSSERLGAGKAPGSAERTAFQQDYDRIVFTSAFRRMKDKTQVFPLSKSDYVRTRLTHSLEASCVGRSLGAVVGREIIARHGLKDVESGDFGAIVAPPAWRTTSATRPSVMPARTPSANGSVLPACLSGTLSRRRRKRISRVTKATRRAFASSAACRARPIPAACS